MAEPILGPIEHSKQKSMFEVAFEHFKGFRQKASESYRFYKGDQWTEEDKLILNKEHRPPLVINKVASFIDYYITNQKNTRFNLKAYPLTGASQQTAETITKLIKHYDDRCKGAWEESQVFRDAMLSGVGWFRTEINYDKDIDGEPSYYRWPTKQIAWDPYMRKWDMSDAGYICAWDWMDIDEAEDRWPEAQHAWEQAMSEPYAFDVGEASSHDSVPGGYYKDNEDEKFTGEYLYVDSSLKRVRIVEVWWKKRVKRYYFMDLETGEETKTSLKKKAVDEMVAMFPDKIEAFTKMEDVMMRTIFSGSVKLEEEESEFTHDGFPFIPVWAYFLDGDCWGPMELMKDPQREINKRRSQMLHALGTTIRTGYRYETGAIKNEKEMKDAGNTPGFNIEMETGMYDKFERMQPPMVDQGIQMMEQQSDQDLSRVANVNPDAMGFRGRKVESGRAIEAKQKAGAFAASNFMDNLRYAKKELGRQMIANIQLVTTEEKVMTILEGSNKSVTITMNQKVFNEIGQIKEILNNPNVGNYDIVVDEGENSITIKQENAMMLLNLAEKMPFLMPILAGPIIDSMDPPNKEEILQKMQMMTGGGQPQPGQGQPQGEMR